MNIDSDLTIVCPVSGETLDAALAKLGNGGLHGIGEACVAAGRKYQINALYIAAHAAHESGWGRSAIARDKHNLFGWCAFDFSPYESARAFPSWDACIDFVMGRISTMYLTVGGAYWTGFPCLGKGGAGAYGMNEHYATDPAWGQKIANVATSIERKVIEVLKEKA